MSAGGPLKRSDFSAKEIHVFTQVYEKILSKEWPKEKAGLFFKNDPFMVKRFNDFSDMRKAEAMAEIVESSGQISLILSKSVGERQKSIDDSRTQTANAIVKEMTTSRSSVKPA